MKNLARLIGLFSLLALMATVALCAQHNLRFVDQSGKPVSDVIVRATYTAMPPALPGGTFDIRSDADGRISIGHPCGPSSGSCCLLVSPVNYTVIGKFGYSFSGGGVVGCGLGPPTDATITGTGQEYPKLSVVSAANFRDPLSSEMIVAAFGLNLATATEIAGLPLPTMLANRRVFIRNSDGQEAPAQLLFVSPQQINFIVPNQSGSSLRTIIVRDTTDQVVSAGFPVLNTIAPGIFTANADGQGVPAAVIVRARADGSQMYEPVAQFDQTSQRFVPLALDLGMETDIVVLALFGTGWRNFNSSTMLSVKVGGINCPVEYVGKQPTVAGLDQINARLPRSLIGKGDATVEVQFTVFGTSATANPVQLKIK